MKRAVEFKNIAEPQINALMNVLLQGESFDDAIRDFLVTLEKSDNDYIASVLLLDQDTHKIYRVIAPTLPDFYNQAITGLSIGKGIGSCGTAAYERNTVIVDNINVHPYWTSFKDLALKAGVQACWSEPILDAKHRCIGTFAIYHRQPRQPSAKQLNLIKDCATLISLALDRFALVERLEQSSMVLDHSPSGIVITDDLGQIIHVNKSYQDITGYSLEEIKGLSLGFLSSGRHDQAFYKKLWSDIKTMSCWKGEIINRKRNGEEFVVAQQIFTIKDEFGNVRRYVGFVEDITERKRAAELIYKQAHFDEVTGLHNRYEFKQRLAAIVQQAKNTDSCWALIFLDLDLFKQINDTHGHEFGDKVLQVTAQRLSEKFGAIACVARIGGDEFAVIAKEQDREQIRGQVKRLLSSLAQPIYLEGVSDTVSVSIGIALYPEDADREETWLRAADLAMYRAKQEGRNCFRFYEEQLHQQHKRKTLLRQRLILALKEGHLELAFQPIVSAEADTICKGEALLRWTDEQLGEVAPCEFIPVAEETGLIGKLGLFVVDYVLTAMQNTELLARVPQVTVNCSALELRDVDWVEQWISLVKLSGVDPSRLAIEITESVLIEEQALVLKQLNRLRDFGVTICLDEFGTGFCSLSYIHTIKPAVIKVARSFVKGIEKDVQQQTLFRAVVQIAEVFDAQVVAEGVETRQQQTMLKTLGCHYLQGELYYSPMPASEFEQLLNN